MKQFTSHIDFSLAKKRLMMMNYLSSSRKHLFKLTIVIPFIFILPFSFCSKSTATNEKLYSNIELHYNPEKADELGINRNTMFTEDEVPFTGVQSFFYVANDSLFSKSTYEKGLLKSSEVIFSDSNRQKYEYFTDRRSFYLETEFMNGQKLMENITPEKGENGLGHLRYWHENGQLKFDTKYTGNLRFEGLMTLYNESGEVIEQERYVDGELLEKIK